MRDFWNIVENEEMQLEHPICNFTVAIGILCSKSWNNWYACKPTQRISSWTKKMMSIFFLKLKLYSFLFCFLNNKTNIAHVIGQHELCSPPWDDYTDLGLWSGNRGCCPKPKLGSQHLSMWNKHNLPITIKAKNLAYNMKYHFLQYNSVGKSVK